MIFITLHCWGGGPRGYTSGQRNVHFYLSLSTQKRRTMSDYISWSETAWATQEERLAVDTKSMNLHIGLPKERKMNEHRILLTPNLYKS